MVLSSLHCGDSRNHPRVRSMVLKNQHDVKVFLLLSSSLLEQQVAVEDHTWPSLPSVALQEFLRDVRHRRPTQCFLLQLIPLYMIIFHYLSPQSPARFVFLITLWITAKLWVKNQVGWKEVYLEKIKNKASSRIININNNVAAEKPKSEPVFP